MKIQIFSILILALILGMPSMAEAKKKAQGVFTVVKGKVSIQRAGKKKARKVRVGTKVYPQDTITASKDSRAKVVMVDENVLNISPESQVQIAEYENDPKSKKKKVMLNLMYGKVRSTVKQKYDGDKNIYRVKTPSAVAGVRGTDFFVDYVPTTRRSQIVTFEGQVTVGSGITPGGAIANAVFVNPGEFTFGTPDAPPLPAAAIPESELANFDRETNADIADTNSNNNQREPANNQRNQGPNEEGNKGPNDKAPGDAKNPENNRGPNARGQGPNNAGPGLNARDEGTRPDSPRDPRNFQNQEGPLPPVAGEGGEPKFEPGANGPEGNFGPDAGFGPNAGTREPAAAIGPEGNNFMPPPPGDFDPAFTDGGGFIGPEPIGEFDQYQPIDPVFNDPALTDGFIPNDQINDNIQNATRLIIEIRQ